MAKVRWGVLSTARIGTEKVIPAMQQASHCEIAAIASRDAARAKNAAQGLGIGKAYGSYEELLADPEIDAVYNPLPNHLHVPLSIQALEAGKHVLCEKPIALSAREAEKLLEASARHPRLKLMEAFMYRHHPQWVAAMQIVRSENFGPVRAVNSVFSYHNVNAGDIRNRADVGGGGLMDIGCYPISVARLAFGAEPRRVLGELRYDPKFNTDRLTSALLDFAEGTAAFICSTQLAPFQRATILGETESVEVEIPYNAPTDKPCRVWHRVGEECEEILTDVCDQYGRQGELFSQAILEDAPPPTPIQDALGNMRVIDAVFRSGESGAWAPVEA